MAAYPIIPPARNGLSECLESYAARACMTRSEARPYWRMHALDALGVLSTAGALCTLLGKCRVAPGVAVPIPGLAPTDVLEDA